MSRSSDKPTDAYVFLVLCLVCMLGFSYRAASRTNAPAPAVSEAERGDDFGVPAHATLAQHPPQPR